MDRRKFLKSTVAMGIGLSAGFMTGRDNSNLFEQEAGRLLPKRTLGKTGEKLSIVGLGGVVMDRMEPSIASELAVKVINIGLNYFDVAPSYGNAEIVMGEALKGHRDKIFLACKTLERSKEGAQKELLRSLERLHTDHFDL